MSSAEAAKKSVKSIGLGLFSFTSRTRNQVFRFERTPATFFGWLECDYKVPVFSYRRPNRIKLCRTRTAGNRARFA